MDGMGITQPFTTDDAWAACLRDVDEASRIMDDATKPQVTQGQVHRAKFLMDRAAVLSNLVIARKLEDVTGELYRSIETRPVS